MYVDVLLPGIVAVEHCFDVPLDHDQPSGELITVFARELADPAGRDRPFLVFFQGGPGFEAVRPTRRPEFGLMVSHVTGTNQNGELVYSAQGSVFVERRVPAPSNYSVTSHLAFRRPCS